MAYGIVETGPVSDPGLFAVPGFLITFRETLEAAIIVFVLLGMLDKVNQPQLKRYVWIGVLSAFGLCVAAGVIILVIVNVLKNQMLSETGTDILEGVLSILASILIAVVALSMGNVMATYKKWENRLTESVEETGEVISKKNILFLSFTSVLREGVETIVFFTGIGAAYPPISLPIPAVVGAIAGVLCGYGLYKCAGQMTIQWFFRVAMVILVFIGAGVFVNGISSLQHASAVSNTGINKELWDISDCCGYQSEFFVMMQVLFGYTPTPSGLFVLMYILYHAVVWTALVLRYKSQMRIDAGKPGYKQLLKEKFCRTKVVQADRKQSQESSDSTSRDSSNEGDSRAGPTSSFQEVDSKDVNLV